MSVVVTALCQLDIRTLMYFDDLLIVCSSFEEVSRVRKIIDDNLLTSGIVRASLMG
jgi:hypothetical protein